MHFVFEALHKRPLESKSLAISRGATAILMSCCFLAYVGYLIYQIYSDRTLLLLSTEDIPSGGYVSPDIEMCVTGSDFSITSCVLQDMNYNEHIMPNCAGFLNPGAQNTDNQHCYAFQGNDSKVMFGVGVVSGTADGQQPATSNQVRRVDIYWAIHNLTAVETLSLSEANIAITTFSQEFSPWRIKPADMQKLLPEQVNTWNSLQLQKHISTSAVNQSTMIYFEPSRYRALKRNALSVIGLNSSYYEIDSIQTNQFEWNLNHLSPKYETYGNYQGQFGVSLKTSNFQIQTEQRQHTVLSALALSGGAYGALTALYILLFGTPRLTPFGMSHNISMWFYRGHNKLSRKKKQDTVQPDEKTVDPHHHEELDSTTCMRLMEESEHRSTLPPRPPPHSILNQSSLLESRVEELEMILREYFLNVEYLDALRLRRQELLPVYQPNPEPASPVDAKEGAPPRKSITGNDWHRST